MTPLLQLPAWTSSLVSFSDLLSLFFVPTILSVISQYFFWTIGNTDETFFYKEEKRNTQRHIHQLWFVQLLVVAVMLPPYDNCIASTQRYIVLGLSFSLMSITWQRGWPPSLDSSYTLSSKLVQALNTFYPWSQLFKSNHSNDKIFFFWSMRIRLQNVCTDWSLSLQKIITLLLESIKDLSHKIRVSAINIA